MTTLSDVLKRLEPYGVKQVGKSWRARCPAHNGQDLNLKIDYEDERVLFYCHSHECPQSEIEAALGIGKASYKSSSPKEQSYEIRDINGKLIALHVRYMTAKGKGFRWGLPNGKMGLGGIKASELPLYGTQEIPRFDRSHWIYINEGEKATDALKALGVQALGTITGASNKEGHNPQTLEVLRGCKVALFPDNDPDQGGLRHMKKHAENLKSIAAELVILDTSSLPPKGDAVEWIDAQLKAGKTKQSLREAFARDEFIDLPRIVSNVESPQKKEEAPKKTQAQIALELVQRENFPCWFDTQGLAWCSFEVEGHTEHHRLNSKATQHYICQLTQKKTGIVLGDRAIKDALTTLEALTPKTAPFPVFVRSGEHEGKIYIDLGSHDWSAIEIDAKGWRVLKKPPVKFRRSKGMMALPVPVKGGDLAELRYFINAPEETKWRFLVAWLLAALRPKGPYPIAILQGEQGCAKSTTARMLRSLVDPNACALRTSPRDERDLAIAATSSWIVAYDNLSGVSEWLSDALCRAATGGGFATRALYSDNEETLLEFQRPVLLNGIDEVATRGDLVDRALLVTLPRIEEENRREESEVWREFEEAKPRILGALLDVISAGLRKLPSIKAKRLPRMADFAKWILACEEALGWEPESFLEDYFGARERMAEAVVDGDFFARTLLRFLGDEANEGRPEWKGTIPELLEKLNRLVNESTSRARTWPQDAIRAANKLRRISPSLSQFGWNADLDRLDPKTRRRIVCFSKAAKDEKAKNEGYEKSSFGGKTTPEEPTKDAKDAKDEIPPPYRESVEEVDNSIPNEEEDLSGNENSSFDSFASFKASSPNVDFSKDKRRMNNPQDSSFEDLETNATANLYGSPGLDPHSKKTSYSSASYSEEEFEEMAGRLQADGYSKEQAETEARRYLQKKASQQRTQVSL
jgi:putative DNA primase/helicase